MLASPGKHGEPAYVLGAGTGCPQAVIDCESQSPLSCAVGLGRPEDAEVAAKRHGRPGGEVRRRRRPPLDAARRHSCARRLCEAFS